MSTQNTKTTENAISTGDLSPDVSADGKRNAYHHLCSVIGNQQAFAACVNKIERRKHGALPVIFATCSAAIGKKVCPAIAMRKEELTKKKAIYFIERPRFMGLSALIDKAKQIFCPPTAKKTFPAHALEKLDVVGKDYMAQALTKAVERHSQNGQDGPKAVGQTVTKLEVRPGETLLQAARRIRGLNHN